MNEKPTKKTIVYYDYGECNRYIEEKYSIKTRDYTRKYEKGKSDPDKEYQDYWHFLMDAAGEFNRGVPFQMDDEWLSEMEMEDWQREITEMFLNEFGETDPDDKWVGPDCRQIMFIADW